MGESMTLGSLFDGIGGFMLAGQYAGIRPVWSSEAEPFPMRVTEIRFPEVKQLGDVHDVHGGEIPPVDIITFGSPCQNLSIAGKRAGLEGAQSSLFFEAIRIIREMREKTNGRYPRWAVWENVPGALSSNDGQDFRQVLQSLAEICDQSADVSMPEKWHGAGEIMGDHYSLAWRILDASKGWGVAQRRRRIFAVLDLTGQRAGAVLFESEGMSGYTPPGGASRQGAADSAAEGAGETGVVCLNDQGGGYRKSETMNTLNTVEQHSVCIPVYSIRSNVNTEVQEEQAVTLEARDFKDAQIVGVPAYCMTVGSYGHIAEDKTPTLEARGYKDPPVVASPAESEYYVRRLTPLECCRLQGYPDGWTQNLGTENPSEEEVQRWTDIFAAWNRLQGGTGKLPGRSRVIKWLKEPPEMPRSTRHTGIAWLCRVSFLYSRALSGRRK